MSGNTTQTTVFWKDYEKMDFLVKNGYSWFDMMYPRGSEEEAKELKIGKYADPKLDALLVNTPNNTSNIRLSGHKRKRSLYY